MNPFILAHGSAAGPLMRPALTGLLAGECSSFILFVVLWRIEWVASLIPRFGVLPTVLGYMAFGGLSGVMYGLIYRRAANDRQGGWIFGSSTGFIFWMVNPITWWPWFGRKPVFLGLAATQFLASHIVYGLFLGILFPFVQKFTSRPLEQSPHKKQNFQSGSLRGHQNGTL
jgi:hypothetical protein